MTAQPLTDDQLAAIQARETAATPGPWYQQPDYGPEFIASEVGGYERGIGDLDFGAGSQARADREFVIAARADVPALLAEVARLRAELAEARKRPVNLARACMACGHSRLTHTVPEPHSCFASGQTCGCPSFADPLLAADPTTT